MDLVGRGETTYGERLAECAGMDTFFLRRSKAEVVEMFPPSEQVRLLNPDKGLQTATASSDSVIHTIHALPAVAFALGRQRGPHREPHSCRNPAAPLAHPPTRHPFLNGAHRRRRRPRSLAICPTPQSRSPSCWGPPSSRRAGEGVDWCFCCAHGSADSRS